MMNSVFLLATLAAACDAGWISSIVRNIPDAADSAAKAAKNAPWDDISFTALDVAGHASQQQQQAAPSKPTREMFSILFRKVGRVECADMPPAACANPTEYLSRADPTACNDTYVNTLDNTVLSVTSNVSCLGLTPADLPCPPAGSLAPARLNRLQFTDCFGGRQISRTYEGLPLSASVTCSAQGGAPVVTVSGEPQAPYLGGNCSAPNTMSIMLMHDVNFTVKSTSLRRFGIANFTRRMARGEMAVIYAQDGDAICAGASHSTGFVRVGLAPATGWDAIVGAGNVSGLVEQECVDTACQLDFAAPQIVGGDDYILVVVQADDDGMVTIRADCDDRFSRPWTGGDSNTGLYIGLGVGFGWLCIICCIICLCKWCAARRAAKAIESDGGAPMESIHQPNEAYNGAPPYQDPNAHSLSMQTTLSHLPAQTAQQSQSHRVDGGQFQCHVCGNAYPTASDIAYHVQLRHQS